jgi:hypothetical protein
VLSAIFRVVVELNMMLFSIYNLSGRLRKNENGIEQMETEQSLQNRTLLVIHKQLPSSLTPHHCGPFSSLSSSPA